MWRRGSVVIAKVDFMFIYVNRSISFFQKAYKYVFGQAMMSLKYLFYLYQRGLME